MRLLSEMKTGDTVVTFDRDRRLYLIGTLSSEYEWAPKLIGGQASRSPRDVDASGPS